MIILKTPEEIAKMRAAGRILASCHQEIGRMLRPGISTWEIDQFVERFLEGHGATPEQKGFHGYPYATCASVNDVICHGFPKLEPLKEGDIVTIDMVVNKDGWLADSAWSYGVGRISEEAARLLDVTKEAMFRGIRKAVAGNRIGDIANAVQTYAESLGYSVVRDFIGHGIGSSMHEGPEVPNYGPAGRGPKLKTGMVFTVEPMLNIGSFRAKVDADGWTARTVDGSLSAQFEHTLAITEEGTVILTEL